MPCAYIKSASWWQRALNNETDTGLNTKLYGTAKQPRYLLHLQKQFCSGCICKIYVMNDISRVWVVNKMPYVWDIMTK